MSTIDINSVAGFKAVDAEGNELGIMSMADITAAVKESIMQDAAMARSVATLSEASTLAATDTYEDQLPQQTDLKWARGLDANGNPILISKESLASVVGGLLSSLKLYPFMFRGDCNDFNDATENGYYQVSSSSTPNLPKGAYGYGTLVVTGSEFQIQLYIPDTYGKIYKRNKYKDSWKNWFEFTGTQIQM